LYIANSGDHDLNVPFLGTEAWIRSLNYSIVDDWRPWLTNGQVAGYSSNSSYIATGLNLFKSSSNYVLNICFYVFRYTRTYSNRMTFAAVKASLSYSPAALLGHT